MKQIAPIYIKELQQYSISDFMQMVGCDKDAAKDINKTLKSYGIVKAVSSETKDFEELSDQDLILTDGTDENDGIRYCFNFVGVIVIGEHVFYSYPKYIKSGDHEAKKSSIKLALKAIQKYISKKQNIFLYDGSDGDSKFNKINMALYLLQDFYVNGLYTAERNYIDINGNGEILWDQTISNTVAFIKNNKPYYFDFFTNETQADDDNFFRRLHECVISDCSKMLMTIGLLDLFDINPVNFNVPCISEFADKEYILQKLDAEIRIQFYDKKRNLLKTLREYVLAEHSATTNDSFVLYGTNVFNLVWEDACSVVFSNLKNKSLQELGLKWDCKKLIDVLEKPIWKWHGHNYKAGATLIPDIVTITNDGSKKTLYILDAKYYTPAAMEKYGISGQPGIDSIIKQFAYQMEFDDFSKSNQIAYVANAFLFPCTDKNDGKEKDDTQKIKVVGNVTMPIFQSYGVGQTVDISCIEVKPQFLFESYIENKSEVAILDTLPELKHQNTRYKKVEVSFPTLTEEYRQVADAHQNEQIYQQAKDTADNDASYNIRH